MTRQEALESFLEKARSWGDRQGTTIPVVEALHRNVMRLLDLREAEKLGPVSSAEVDAALIVIGGAALFLVSDPDVPVPRELAEWMADDGDRQLLAPAPRFVKVNGQIGRVLPDA